MGLQIGFEIIAFSLRSQTVSKKQKKTKKLSFGLHQTVYEQKGLCFIFFLIEDVVFKWFTSGCLIVLQ